MNRILIVEDELIPANYFKKVLQKEGYDIIGIVTKGADAIRSVRHDQPDIILMDIMLSDNISGTDAALSISREFPNIQIIFLTAYTEDQMLEQALESKAYAYLVKPYREKEIITTIKLAERKVHQSSPKTDTHVALIEPYSFDLKTQRLFNQHTEVLLGPVAIKLIAFLCKTPHSSVAFEVIMNHLWDEEASAQSLRSLIHRIREQTSKELILNVNKLGYKINAKH
jgi:DNA-binding response OmpR family regulator